MDLSTLMVLETRLIEEADEVTDRPRINCSRKVAYGCGEHGQELVGGLSLHVRRLDHHPNLTCRLTISLGQEAIRSVRAELGAGSRGRVEAEGALQIVSQQLLVLIAAFRIRNFGQIDRYLVYDATDASLYMIPHIPNYIMACKNTTTPVPRRTGDGRGPQLFLMARTSWCEPVKREFLCMCTLPKSGAKPGSDSSDSSIAWQMKEQRFPNVGSFSADVMFSFQGKVFWADLSKGLVFCDPEQLGRDSVVKHQFIRLPKECQIKTWKNDIDCFDRHKDEVPEPAMRSRNMVCVGGSIKFICIDRSRGYGHEMVKLWTLNLLSQEWEPEPEKSIRWNELRKQVVVYPLFRDLEPRYPNLLPDGTLCLLVYYMRQIRHTAYDYICRIDMSSKRLLSSGRFRHFSTAGPVVLPCDFFARCCSPPPPPRQSKLQTKKRKMDSIWGQTPAGSSAGVAQVWFHDYTA